MLLAAALALAPVAAGRAVASNSDPPGRPCLTVRIYPDGPELLRAVLPAENPVFSVAFRHSVEKTEVVEHFRIVDEPTAEDGAQGVALVLVGTEYRSLGAGLPPEGHLQESPDGPSLAVRLWRRLDALVIRVMPLAQHVLILPDGRHVALAERVAQAPADPQGVAAPPEQGVALQFIPACGEGTGEGTDG